MKKLLMGMLAMFMGLTIATAQAPATAKKEVKATKAKTEQQAAKVKAATKPVVTSPATADTKVKKDGTPDKRFKENKTNTPVVAGPAKKDGTPDMRYKANNKKAGKKKS